ncbi:MAG: tRNA 4-thiouridine(8) synthase ThiI [Syntrophales bacterium]|nr:tRNA 4-thiouridine(8) synthase ThiI [Syntrophales bacterium]
MKIKSIALFSGGLDSILAAKIMMGMGIEVEGVVFETPFFSAQKATMAARAIGLPLTVIDLTAPHLLMLKAPRYGYGKNMNPCIDCHTLMLQTAGARMEATGADFVFTGEVLGQRPMSQTKQSINTVAKNSGYGDVILRPLSAQLLPETKPEREGKVDRSRLLAIQGRGRKIQMDMARNYGITDYPPPAGGCLLTDPNFSRRLRDLFDHQPDCRIRDIELLKFGRHFRTPEGCKVIVGRDQNDNEAILRLSEETDAVLQMADCAGPTILVPAGGDDQSRSIAAALCVLYSSAPPEQARRIVCRDGRRDLIVNAKALSRQEAERMLL